MMRGQTKRLGRVLLGCALSLVAPAVAQETAPPPALGFTDAVSVEWVTVPVFGPAVDDRLTAKAFRLRVDGQPVRLESFDRDRSPLGLLYAQDLSGSMELGGRLDLSRQILALVQAGIGPDDEMAVLTFAGPEVRLQVPFTTAIERLVAAPASWRGYGTTALYDALATIPAVARESHRQRRGVLLVTDGTDNASTVAPETARELLAGAGLPLFIVDVDQSFSDPEEPVLLPELDSERLTLAQLAAATGGRYSIVADRAAAQRAALDLLTDLRRQVLLAFTVRAGEAEAWHDIEVELRRHRGELRYRSRYFGAPPTGHEPARISRRRRGARQEPDSQATPATQRPSVLVRSDP